MGLGDIFKFAAPFMNAIPGVGPLASIAMGALGGALGNRAQTTNQTSTTHGTQATDMLTGPEYDAKTQLLRDHLINAYMGRMEGNDDFFGGYTRNNLANINAGADSAQRQIENALASRGISGGGMAASGLSQPLIAAMGQRSNLLNSIPMLQDQRQQQLLKDTGGFLSSLPIAQRQRGTVTNDSTTKGTMTTPSNMLAGAFQGAGSTLASLYGNGAFGKKDGPVENVPYDTPYPQIDWGSSQPSYTPTMAPPPLPSQQPWNEQIYRPQLPR